MYVKCLVQGLAQSAYLLPGGHCYLNMLLKIFHLNNNNLAWTGATQDPSEGDSFIIAF